MRTIKALFAHSLTILWARCVALIGVMLAFSDQLVDLLGLPGVKDQVQAILDAKYVPFYVIAIAIVTELAHRRSLPNQKDDA